MKSACPKPLVFRQDKLECLPGGNSLPIASLKQRVPVQQTNLGKPDGANMSSADLLALHPVTTRIAQQSRFRHNGTRFLPHFSAQRFFPFFLALGSALGSARWEIPRDFVYGD